MVAQDRPMLLVMLTVVLMVVFVVMAGIGLLQLSSEAKWSVADLLAYLPFIGEEEELTSTEPMLSDKQEEEMADEQAEDVAPEVMVPETLGFIDYPVVNIDNQVSAFAEPFKNEELQGETFALVSR